MNLKTFTIGGRLLDNIIETILIIEEPFTLEVTLIKPGIFLQTLTDGLLSYTRTYHLVWGAWTTENLQILNEDESTPSDGIKLLTADIGPTTYCEGCVVSEIKGRDALYSDSINGQHGIRHPLGRYQASGAEVIVDPSILSFDELNITDFRVVTSAATDGSFLYLAGDDWEFPANFYLTIISKNLVETMSNESVVKIPLHAHQAWAGYIEVFVGSDAIYCIPHTGTNDNDMAKVMRVDKCTYEVTGFNIPNSDTTPNIRAYSAAAFDGRYIYMVSPAYSYITKFDTMTDTMITVETDTSIIGFTGAKIIKDTLYLTTHHVMSDISMVEFNIVSNEITIIDLYNMTTDSLWFSYIVSEGRYLYLIPGRRYSTPNSILGIYDTETKSFVTQDLSADDERVEGFFSAAFDGRYIYMAPDLQLRDDDSTEEGFRSCVYDTKVNKVQDIFITNRESSTVKGFAASLFDGEHVYLFPGGYSSHQYFLRFEALINRRRENFIEEGALYAR